MSIVQEVSHKSDTVNSIEMQMLNFRSDANDELLLLRWLCSIGHLPWLYMHNRVYSDTSNSQCWVGCVLHKPDDSYRTFHLSGESDQLLLRWCSLSAYNVGQLHLAWTVYSPVPNNRGSPLTFFPRFASKSHLLGQFVFYKRGPHHHSYIRYPFIPCICGKC